MRTERIALSELVETTWVPLSALAHVGIKPDAGRLARLRMSRHHREKPIGLYLAEHGGTMLGDGQHRLFLARQAGATSIEAAYLAESELPSYEADEETAT